jgi:hypothetical protein
MYHYDAEASNILLPQNKSFLLASLFRRRSILKKIARGNSYRRSKRQRRA